jgi:hypothetical protein
MASFVTNESSEDSFTLSAAQPWHLDTSNSIVLNQATQVQAFTAAQYSGVNIYALDHNNAQLLLDRQAFVGYLLNANDQTGLSNIALPAGQWWIGVTYNGSSLSSGQTVAGFDEVSTVSMPGASFIGNVPMGVGGNAGAWRSQGFTITGTPSLYIETEGSGGKFMIQTASQYQAFQSAYGNGFGGGSYSFIYALGGTSGGADTEIEGQLQLPQGTYYLTWVNDSGGWAGGAADISAFGSAGAGSVSAGTASNNGNGSGSGGTSHPDFAAIDTTTGQPVSAGVQTYIGPVSGLQEEYISITSDNLNVSVSSDNWFIHTGSGADAITVHGGTNVLDGGTGSNFLTGGTGTDTFFVDDRSATADIWSTVVGFHSGDAATIWGVTPQDFGLNWVDGQGAAGYTGLTLHATESGKPTASLTLAGYSTADLNNGRLSVSFGTVGGSTYMYVHGNS